MSPNNRAQDASLLDVLIDGFEKNESIGGLYIRQLPLLDAAAAIAKFNEFSREGRRWKGEPVRDVEKLNQRLIAWPDLRICQAGRGVILLVRSPGFTVWWQDDATWDDNPMNEVWGMMEKDVLLQAV